MIQKYQMWVKKENCTSEYNKFMSNSLDAKITQKKLVNESGLNEW